MYAGANESKDFFVLELSEGFPVYTYDVGSGLRSLSTKHPTLFAATKTFQKTKKRFEFVAENHLKGRKFIEKLKSTSVAPPLSVSNASEVCKISLHDGVWHQVSYN